MKIVLMVGIGSFIGGILRYLLSQLIQNKFPWEFPLGTLLVNIAGCFLMGIVFGLYEKSLLNHEMKIFLATGLLGGFTTFSAFSYESIFMLRHGNQTGALVYIILSICLGLIFTLGGAYAIKLLKHQ